MAMDDSDISLFKSMMDDVMNTLTEGPSLATPVEDNIATLNDKLRKNEEERQELRRQLENEERKREGKRKKVGEGKEVESTAMRKEEYLHREEEYLHREKIAQLRYNQMYGEDIQRLNGELTMHGHYLQQPNQQVDPEEYLNLDDFLTDDILKPPIDEEGIATLEPELEDTRCLGCGIVLPVTEGAAKYGDTLCSECEALTGATALELKGLPIPKMGREQHVPNGNLNGSSLSKYDSDAQMSCSSEQCSFCHDLLPVGSSQSHLSGCHEYHRWSGAGSNDPFFYNPRRSFKKGCSSDKLIDDD